MNREHEKGEQQVNPPALVSIDLSHVYSLVRHDRKKTRELPPPSSNLALWRLGTEVEDEARLAPISRAPLELALASTRERRLPARVATLHRLGRHPANVQLRQLDDATYRVSIGADGGTATVDFYVPAGLRRFVNAATLKAMVGARPADMVLRQDGDRWEICPDTYVVDLEDRSQVFRIRQVQVYS